jgi:hypothetical protein
MNAIIQLTPTITSREVETTEKETIEKEINLLGKSTTTKTLVEARLSIII